MTFEEYMKSIGFEKDPAAKLTVWMRKGVVIENEIAKLFFDKFINKRNELENLITTYFDDPKMNTGITQIKLTDYELKNKHTKETIHIIIYTENSNYHEAITKVIEQ